MFGISVLAMYMLMCRYSDLCRLRWEDGHFIDHGHYLRFYLDCRKNDRVWKGQYIDVAEQAAASATDGIVAVDLFRRARIRFGLKGPSSGESGSAVPASHSSRPPSSKPTIPSPASPAPCLSAIFNDMLRVELILCCKLDMAYAMQISSHGTRAAACSSLVRGDVPERLIINNRAGVTTCDWVVTSRIDSERRLKVSRGLGF
jgi:hypothetical protein